MKQKILFVDDEIKILSGLRRMLHPMRNEWEMEFVDSGEKALSAMKQGNYDVVVSDMRMPGMDGPMLMSRMAADYPKTVRIALSGHLDPSLVMKTVKSVHQFLSKPCDLDTLKFTIERAMALRDFLSDEKLLDLVSGMENLPAIPPLYEALTKELRKEEPSIQAISETISADVGMTAKLLQMVNSSFFGMPRTISRPFDAVNLLGLDLIRSLVLSCELFEQFERQENLPPDCLKFISTHSQRISGCVKAVARQEDFSREQQSELFLAAMLHDVGKLVFASRFPDRYVALLAEAEKSEQPHWKAEIQEFGVDHSALGAYLMGLWGLSPAVVQLIAQHHLFDILPQDRITPAGVLHTVNIMPCAAQPDADGIWRPPKDMSALEIDILAGRYPRWEETCKDMLDQNL